MDALMVLLVANGVLAVVSLVNAVAAVRCSRRAQADLRRVARERHHLNRTLTYESGRTLR